MASAAHCIFCFEVLQASFDDSKAPRLEPLLRSYDRHVRNQKTSPIAVEIEEEKIAPISDERRDDRSTLQLPSISKIRDSTPSSASGTSTPSSANSTSTQATTPNPSTPDLRPSYASTLSVTASYPMFVTWNVISRSGHKSLRGCIGTFDPLPLEHGLSQYSLTSAFDDTRFSPIPQSLLPSLSCSLTLLADFQPCSDPFDWELGTHGIKISFYYRTRRYGATYLPDVAIEQGWSKEETLHSLMRKAGYDRRTKEDPWDAVQDFKVVRYTGLKASGSHQEWTEWKSWAKQNTPDLWS